MFLQALQPNCFIYLPLTGLYFCYCYIFHKNPPLQKFKKIEFLKRRILRGATLFPNRFFSLSYKNSPCIALTGSRLAYWCFLLSLQISSETGSGARGITPFPINA